MVHQSNQAKALSRSIAWGVKDYSWGITFQRSWPKLARPLKSNHPKTKAKGLEVLRLAVVAHARSHMASDSLRPDAVPEGRMV